MLRVYAGLNSLKKLTSEGRLASSFETALPYWYFCQKQKDKSFGFSEEDLAILKDIEYAFPINSKCSLFRTKFGDRLTVEEFSSGTKTLLAIIHDIKPGWVYNMTSSGPNVWSYLFAKYGYLDRELYTNYAPVGKIPATPTIVEGICCDSTTDMFREIMKAVECE